MDGGLDGMDFVRTGKAIHNRGERKERSWYCPPLKERSGCTVLQRSRAYFWHNRYFWHEGCAPGPLGLLLLLLLLALFLLGLHSPQDDLQFLRDEVGRIQCRRDVRGN